MFISKESTYNLFHYAHIKNNLCFNSELETEIAILKKLEVEHGVYTKLNSEEVTGVPLPMYKRGKNSDQTDLSFRGI